MMVLNLQLHVDDATWIGNCWWLHRNLQFDVHAIIVNLINARSRWSLKVYVMMMQPEPACWWECKRAQDPSWCLNLNLQVHKHYNPSRKPRPYKEPKSRSQLRDLNPHARRPPSQSSDSCSSAANPIPKGFRASTFLGGLRVSTSPGDLPVSTSLLGLRVSTFHRALRVITSPGRLLVCASHGELRVSTFPGGLCVSTSFLQKSICTYEKNPNQPRMVMARSKKKKTYNGPVWIVTQRMQFCIFEPIVRPAGAAHHWTHQCASFFKPQITSP